MLCCASSAAVAACLPPGIARTPHAQTVITLLPVATQPSQPPALRSTHPARCRRRRSAAAAASGPTAADSPAHTPHTAAVAGGTRRGGQPHAAGSRTQQAGAVCSAADSCRRGGSRSTSTAAAAALVRDGVLLPPVRLRAGQGEPAGARQQAGARACAGRLSLAPCASQRLSRAAATRCRRHAAAMLPPCRRLVRTTSCCTWAGTSMRTRS